MPFTRVDAATVVDDETGQTYYFPDLPEEDRSVPQLTRGEPDTSPTGDPWWLGPPGPPQVDIGQAQIEPQVQVDVGQAQIESDGQHYNDTMAMTGRLPPGATPGTAGSAPANPMSPDEVVARIAAATPAAPTGAPAPAGGPPGGPLDPYGAAAADPVTGQPMDPYAAPRRPGMLGQLDDLDARNRKALARQAMVAEDVARETGAGARQEADEAAEFAKLQDQEMRAAETRATERWNDWKKKNDEAAASEINPERFWDSRTEFQKAAWVIALFAHGWVNVGKHNQIADMLQQSIDRDMAAQEKTLAARERGLGREADALARQDAQDQNALMNRATAYNLRITALQRATEARVKALGPAAANADYEKALAALDEEKLKNEAAVIKAAQDEAYRQAQLNIERGRLAIARRAAAAKAKPEKPAEAPAGPNIDPRTGVTTVVTNPDGTKTVIKGGFALEKTADQGKNMAMAAASGNKEYTALVALKKALSDQTLLDKLRASDADVRAEAVKLAYARARQLGGPGVLSNQDVDTAMKTVTGQEGIKAWDYFMTPGDPIEIVDEGIRTLKARVTNEIVGTGAVDVSRGEVQWNPTDLSSEKPGPRSALDVRTEASGAIGGETGARPLRNPAILPLGDLPPGIRQGVYESEKRQGRLPKLAPGEQDTAVESLIAAVSQPTAPLADIDAAIRQVETSRLDKERKARALAELRAVRAQAARRDADAVIKKDLLRRGTAK